MPGAGRGIQLLRDVWSWRRAAGIPPGHPAPQGHGELERGHWGLARASSSTRMWGQVPILGRRGGRRRAGGGTGDLQSPSHQRFCGSAHPCFELEAGLEASRGLSCPTPCWSTILRLVPGSAESLSWLAVSPEPPFVPWAQHPSFQLRAGNFAWSRSSLSSLSVIWAEVTVTAPCPPPQQPGLAQ